MVPTSQVLPNTHCHCRYSRRSTAFIVVSSVRWMCKVTGSICLIRLTRSLSANFGSEVSSVKKMVILILSCLIYWLHQDHNLTKISPLPFLGISCYVPINVTPHYPLTAEEGHYRPNAASSLLFGCLEYSIYSIVTLIPSNLQRGSWFLFCQIST